MYGKCSIANKILKENVEVLVSGLVVYHKWAFPLLHFLKKKLDPLNVTLRNQRLH